jgi:UDP-GlcNAc3NAcA epimerase
VNTGQHYDYEMNRQFFSELELPDPSTDLNVGAGSPNEQVSAIISGLGNLFDRAKPDLALVPGDTNSALAAGIACSKSRVPLAHLESGCRSGDFRMAEEVNRRLLDHMSDLLLCPTPSCARNVRSEHVLAKWIFNVGDTMYDSLLTLIPRAKTSDAPQKYGLQRGGYAFMTMHRAETVDDAGALGRVIDAVGNLSLTVAFSVHPRTRARIMDFGIKPEPNIKLLEPLPYIETLGLVDGAEVVITDSGGLQKEAYWLGIPSMITRDTTEWSDIVKAGAAVLVGTDRRRIIEGYGRLQKVGRKPFAKSRQIFGDGNASHKVVQAVSRFLHDGPNRK